MEQSALMYACWISVFHSLYVVSLCDRKLGARCILLIMHLCAMYWLCVSFALAVYWLSSGCLLAVFWLCTVCVLSVYWLSLAVY